MYACFAGSVFDSTRLRFSGAGAKKSVGHNNGIPGCHQYITSRLTSGGKGPCMMAAFTVSHHFMATLGAPRPSRAERNGNCSPTHAASSSRWRRRAAAGWTKSLEGRARVQHMRTHQNGICSSFSTVHDHHRQQTIGRTMQTLQTNRKMSEP